MIYASESAEAVLTHLHTSPAGLTTTAAERIRTRLGSNRLTEKTTPFLTRLLEPFLSPFVALLLFSAVVSFMTGKYLDSVVIIVIILSNAVIYYTQQVSTARAVAALRQTDTRQVEVERDGRPVKLAVEELVPGDIMHIREGLRIPADIRLLEARHVSLNESALTGESVPVTKQTKPVSPKTALYKQACMAFAGTTVVSGTGLGVVVATGDQTELGKIAQLVEAADTQNPIEKKIERLTRGIIYVVVVLGLIIFGLELWRGTNVVDALRFVLSLAVSAVPEGLPVALTVVLVFGVRRMARRQVLVRHMQAVETLGALTLVVTDKTGTITHNRLTIANEFRAPNIPVDRLRLAMAGSVVQEHDVPADFLDELLAGITPRRTPPGEVVAVFPFVQRLRMSGAIWRHGRGYQLYVKGAPEALIKRSDMSAGQQTKLLAALEQQASQGARLIGFACVSLPKPPSSLQAGLSTTKLKYLGSIALSDTIRTQVPSALRRLRTAGVDVVMLTGDHPQTAHHIGRRIGLLDKLEDIGDRQSLYGLSEAEFADYVGQKKVFARVLPEDKFAFIRKLKGREIIAMTGDGVNDVPALAEADVGFAMGTGTDAAKDAADMTLLDDNFKTIVEAITEGRRIIANIQRMVLYLLSTNIGEVAVMIGALLLGWPLPITALQILWINLVTDGLTVIPLGLEPADETAMRRPPRPPQAPLLDRRQIALLVAISCNVAIVTLAVYGWMLRLHPDQAQSFAFTILTASQWVFALTLRSDSARLRSVFNTRNHWLWFALLGAVGLQLLVLYGPLSEVFATQAIPLAELLPVVGLVCLWHTVFGLVAKRLTVARG